jgi:DNA-binding CsgD family transcriptional regulator
VKLAEAARDDALHAYALAMLALVRFDRRDPDALAIAKEAYGRASRAADAGALMRAGSAVGHILTWMGDIPAARQWLGDQLEAWGHHDERGRSDALWYLSLVEFEAGRWTEAEAAAREAREISEQYGSVAGWIFLPGALIQLHRGELDAVRSEALALIENDEDRPLDHAFAIVATCDLWSGDVERSVPRFARAEQAADERGIGEPAMRRWRPDYAEALVRLGRLEEAVALIDAWDHDARPLRRHRVLADVTRSRGVIAAARGRHDEAELLLIEAAGAHLAAGDSFGRARALLTLGTVRRRRREKRAAREPIAQAIAEFQDLGARSWAAAAAAEMRRIGGRERVAGLTESERRVAALVAEGRTNREIGAALFLGERTVASHLSHIYGKLGIRSRTELAHRFSAGIDPAPPVGKVPSS